MSITLANLKGNTLSLSAPQNLTITNVEVVKELNLAANIIDVSGSQIPSTPSIPLIMNVTGYHGGIASFLNLTIDPLVVIFDTFSIMNGNVNLLTPYIEFVNGYVGGEMFLTTSNQLILVDNINPGPSSWATLQLYQPGGSFVMSENGNAIFANTYAAFYTGTLAATITDYFGAGAFTG